MQGDCITVRLGLEDVVAVAHEEFGDRSQVMVHTEAGREVAAYLEPLPDHEGVQVVVIHMHQPYRHAPEEVQRQSLGAARGLDRHEWCS